MPIYLFLPEVDVLQIHVLQSSFYKSMFYKSSPIPIFLERAMWLSTNHWNTIQRWRNHLHTTKTFYYDDETLKFVSKQRTRNHWVIKHIKTRQPGQWYILTRWDAWKSTLSRTRVWRDKLTCLTRQDFWATYIIQRLYVYQVADR